MKWNICYNVDAFGKSDITSEKIESKRGKRRTPFAVFVRIQQTAPNGTQPLERAVIKWDLVSPD